MQRVCKAMMMMMMTSPWCSCCWSVFASPLNSSCLLQCLYAINSSNTI